MYGHIRIRALLAQAHEAGAGTRNSLGCQMACFARRGRIARILLRNRTAMRRAFGSTRVRIASYNLLSDKLCDPGYFKFCAAEHCEPNFRLQMVKAKLSKEMKQGSILCLQEVSRKWGAKLMPLLDQYGYSHAAALSGSKKNGYMGQTMAWDHERYKLMNTETVCLADTVPSTTFETENSEKVEIGFFQSIYDRLWGVPKARSPKSSWQLALNRHNCVVVSRLKDRQSGFQFCVANYHMPCLFGSNRKLQVMTIHVALLMQVGFCR